MRWPHSWPPFSESKPSKTLVLHSWSLYVYLRAFESFVCSWGEVEALKKKELESKLLDLSIYEMGASF